MLRFNPGIRLPKIMTRWFPGAWWRIPVTEKQVFLTFDDGPVPEVTPWVLDLLKKENMKACFFCVGENVSRNPEIYQRILAEGHQVGNHTFNHVQGLKITDAAYFENIEKAAGYIDSAFFRPPHGWMKRSQFKQVKKHYQVVMWDIISCDYKKELSPEQVAGNVLDFARSGSVIIFHDSYKSQKNLYQALPVVIHELKKRGFGFGSLPEFGT